MRAGLASVAVVAGLLAGRAAAQQPAARLLAPIAGDSRPVRADDDRPEPAVRFAADATPARRTTPRRPAVDPPAERDPPADRDSRAFDGLKDWWHRQTDRRGGFESDHAFDALVSPVTSPFTFEDPRTSTEVRGLFLYQKVPDAQPNFRGGSAWFAGAQVRLALSERFSLVLSKLGAASLDPKAATPFATGTGLSELWVGPKYLLVRDEEHGTLLAAGATVQIPVGSGRAFQDTGSLSVAPYLSLAHPFLKSSWGVFNGTANGGYSFSVNRSRSDGFYVNGHLDFDVGNKHRFYPLAELSYTQTTTEGRERPVIQGEGRDLFNAGGRGKGGLLTGAVGGRVKLTKSLDLGAAFEVPLAGGKDFFGYRVTADLVWRY